MDFLMEKEKTHENFQDFRVIKTKAQVTEI